MTRRKRSDELDAALRADPDYQELGRLLDKQTACQKARLEVRLAQEGGEAMESKKDLDSYIIDLRDNGKLSLYQIAQKLNEEGHKTSTGTPFGKSTVQSRYERAKKKLPSQPSQPSQEAPADQVTAAPQDKLSGEPCEPSPVVIPSDWLAPLRKLIREEIQLMTPNAAILTNAPDIAPPPVPRKKGTKEYEGDRATLPGCRVDKNLFDLFEEDRKRAGSASLVMQKILWTYYGRPALSFEKDKPKK